MCEAFLWNWIGALCRSRGGVTCLPSAHPPFLGHFFCPTFLPAVSLLAPFSNIANSASRNCCCQDHQEQMLLILLYTYRFSACWVYSWQILFISLVAAWLCNSCTSQLKGGKGRKTVSLLQDFICLWGRRVSCLPCHHGGRDSFSRCGMVPVNWSCIKNHITQGSPMGVEFQENSRSLLYYSKLTGRCLQE